jgi:hypothetical protein
VDNISTVTLPVLLPVYCTERIHNALVPVCLADVYCVHNAPIPAAHLSTVCINTDGVFDGRGFDNFIGIANVNNVYNVYDTDSNSQLCNVFYDMVINDIVCDGDVHGVSYVVTHVNHMFYPPIV